MSDLIDRGEEIYLKIKGKLKGQEGKMIAIDVDSGDYFIGEDPLEACDKGNEKYPDKLFYITKIGAKAAFFVGAL